MFHMGTGSMEASSSERRSQRSVAVHPAMQPALRSQLPQQQQQGQGTTWAVPQGHIR
jgi:hypothetical protein